MAFLEFPLLLCCLLVAFAILYAKKGSQLHFVLLLNEHFVGKTFGDQNLSSGNQKFWLVPNWHLISKVNFGP